MRLYGVHTSVFPSFISFHHATSLSHSCSLVTSSCNLQCCPTLSYFSAPLLLFTRYYSSFCYCAISASTVPSILLSTLEPPSSVAIRGRGTLIQVRVLFNRKRLKGEENAIDFSKVSEWGQSWMRSRFLTVGSLLQQLPFLEYKLYTRLLNKVRIKGMNAVFSLSTQYIVGDTVVIGIAVSLDQAHVS